MTYHRQHDKCMGSTKKSSIRRGPKCISGRSWMSMNVMILIVNSRKKRESNQRIWSTLNVCDQWWDRIIYSSRKRCSDAKSMQQMRYCRCNGRNDTTRMTPFIRRCIQKPCVMSVQLVQNLCRMTWQLATSLNDWSWGNGYIASCQNITRMNWKIWSWNPIV
jgi:hypothetical protein